MADRTVRSEIQKLWDRDDPESINQQLELVQAIGLLHSWRDVKSMVDMLGSRIGYDALPPYACEFVAAVADHSDADRVLDPMAGMGDLLTAVISSDEDTRQGTGITASTRTQAIAKAVSEGLPIEWIEADPVEALHHLDTTFDLIVSAPPFGRPERRSIPVNGHSERVRGAPGLLVQLEASRVLAEEGRLIFLAHNSLFFRKESVWTKGGAFGLHPEAVISLPAGTLSTTNTEPNIVVMSRSDHDTLFVARLADPEQIEPIVSNLVAHSAGQKPELGRLVEPDHFVSWEALKLNDEIEQLARRSGMKAVPLEDIVEAIDTARDENGFDDLAWRDREAAEGEAVGTPNRVFIPRFGNGPVVTQVADLQAAHKHYLCLQLDPERVYADFMVQLLNADFGMKLRAHWAGGRIQKALPGRDRLMECTMYLPDPEQQEVVIDAQQHIDDLRLQLNELEGRLWTRPVQGEEIQREIGRLNRDEGLDTWIESLPFPVASILRRYHAQADLRAQQDLIIDFFEALTEFVATIMLSAMRQDEARFDERKTYWLGDDEQYREALTESSFGTWRNIAERLAKDARRMLSGDERAACIELYRAPSFSWLDAITNKKLYGVLDTMNQYRNRWRHGATPGQRELERRLQMLTKELSAARGIIEHAFESVDLLMPLDARYRYGVYTYTAKQLTGSNQIFEEGTVETTTPMEDDRLHLLDAKSDRPLELLPFFTMMPSPSTQHDTCYFYNRLEGGEDVRWLTYHTETNHEETVSSPEVASLLRDIMRSDEGAS